MPQLDFDGPTDEEPQVAERSEEADMAVAERTTGARAWPTGVRGFVLGVLVAVVTLLALEAALPGELP
ncbi:hypothetical protein GCM10009844_02570 [Nocardioides koreensis]|uniref:Uncharacterized protein n=1 Tax=Nocardioides koreensis TaxID=433651 RepID=A0ABP5KRT5_9ACTN